MRLLLYTNVFPNPVLPTKGTFNRQLARALAVEHDLRVITPVSWVEELKAGKSIRRDVVDGIEVRYPRFVYPPKVGREHFGWWLWHSSRRTAESLFKEWRPEAVVAYWSHPDGEVAVRLAQGLGVPGVVMVGGSDVNLLMKAGRRRAKILAVLNAADAVVTVSRDLRTTLLAAGIPAEKICVIDRGVDAGTFFPGDRVEARRRLGLPVDGRLILWVGRMVEVKGLDVLLSACSELKTRGESFRVQLVGDGGLRKALEARSVALGLGDVVGFAGSKSHDALPDWYRAADLTVLPSLTEGIPNVLRESLACGTPFVASRVGGIPELVGGIEDRCPLVPPGDPVALADALAMALRSVDVRPTSALGSSLSWAESASSLIRLVDSLRSPAPAKSGEGAS